MPDLAIVKPDDLDSRAAALVVDSAESYTLALEIVRGYRALEDSIEASYRPIIAAAHKVHKAACDELKAKVRPVQEARAAVELKATPWAEMLRAVQRDAERAAKEAAQREMETAKRIAAETGVSALDLLDPTAGMVPAAPSAQGAALRGRWYAVVEDPALVPREWLIVDQQALDREARETKAPSQIPGVRFECDKKLSVSK